MTDTSSSSLSGILSKATATIREAISTPRTILVIVIVPLATFILAWLAIGEQGTGSARTTLSIIAALATLLGTLLSTAILQQTLPSRTNTQLQVVEQPAIVAQSDPITGTLKLEQEIARAKAILRSIGDGVVVRDNQGQIVMLNKAAEEMLARADDSRVSPLANIGWKDVRANKEDTVTSQNRRLEIGDRIVRARMSPVMTDEGQMVGTILVMHDVTRQAAAERLKDDFMNSISHELRTPLTVIKGYSDLLRLETMQAKPDAYKRAMGAIFEHAESLEGMITRIIDLSEMSAGTLWLDTQQLDLNQFVQGALQDWEDALREAKIKPQVQAYADDLQVEGDQRRLRWAFDALLENARLYSPRGGDLVVKTSRIDSAAVLQIIDQGVGISAADLPHVFKRFYRGSPTDKDGSLLDPRGLGQGLYVVKSVVEAHGGRVWVESVVGQGSEFSLLLPLAASNG